MSRTASRLIIQGRVQGVGYRWWATQTAHRLGVAGWVRNLSDGSVEALAIGDPAAVQQFAAACRQGPAHAAVTSVEVAPAQDDGSSGFDQRATR